VKVPALDTSVFLIPADRVKNGEERLVVLNRVARSVLDSLILPQPPGFGGRRDG